MGLSSELIDQLVKVTQNTEPRDKDNTAYGTVVVMGSKKYVKIDGSDLMTPVSSTVAVENGDRVIVTIKNHSATVTGNTTSPAASDKKVTELGTKISDFEIVIADKVSAKELDVQIGRIDDLTADNATIKETLTANKASIDDLTAKNAEITGTLEANKAKIDDLDAKKLDADIADIKYASVDRLDATDANLRNLKSDYAQFEKTTTGELQATNAKIDGLDTKYANVDFSNIGKAAIERFYATSGIIKDLVVGDQTITGELVGITISGDLIKGNTIVADKLVVKGSDGLYYKLNTDGVTTEKEQTEYNSLNGQIIQAKSITATKIDVKDLVAFGATIGGFNIGQNSIFSGVKETVDNKSRGIYMDKNGQIAIGDVNNYIKYFKDTDGKYRLKISAASLEFNASGDSGEESKDLETVIKDINNRVDGIAETNKGIGSITNYYLATSASSGVTTETAGWTTKIQNVSSSKKYLWNYEVTKYTDDTVANTTEPCIIGMYSAVGATGNGIQKITEYYALSALKDSVPTVWSENVPNLTATNKYLWNYEEILYTNGGTELTKKRIIGVYGDTGKDGAKGEKGDTGSTGKNALQPKRNWTGTFTTIGETANVSTSTFNRTPVVGDVFTNLDGSSNTGTWEVTKIENGQVYFKLLSYVNSKGEKGNTGATGATGPKGETGAPGKDANQVVHTVVGNGNTNKYIEFATVKVIQNYANYATTFKISGREYETTDVQFSFVSGNTTDPGLYFLRATGGFNVWMYKKTTSTWGLVTKLNEALGYMRVYNFQRGNDSISITWTDTRYASLPTGCIAADQLQAAKTATNFMEFTSGTGLQIGDKTNGTWKGFRSRITSTAFEILNEAGAAVASYGRKLIQLGKDSTDAVIELCGGKGTIKYENVWLYGGEDDTLTINAENMAILSDKNIVIRAKRVTADNIRITNQLFMSDDSIHITMYEMNADLPDEADDCIAGIDIDKKSGINLETLGVTDKALTGVSINGRSLLNHIYPVGSIYMSTSAINPSNFFGGTWVAWGAGRVPVGFNGSDGNFNSSEKTGGSKTINIQHNHGLSNARAAVGRADSSLSTMSYTSGGNPHNVYFDREFSYYGGISGGSKHATDTSLIYGNTNNGGSTAASVLQPYITCYMWKRTA